MDMEHEIPKKLVVPTEPMVEEPLKKIVLGSAWRRHGALDL